jgi:hypothetical protein
MSSMPVRFADRSFGFERCFYKDWQKSSIEGAPSKLPPAKRIFGFSKRPARLAQRPQSGKTIADRTIESLRSFDVIGR